VLSRWVLARTIPTMHPFTHPPVGAALPNAMLALTDGSNPLNAQAAAR
jgi:hypothetical protein